MRILGLDPGYDRLGFGYLELIGDRVLAIEFGCLSSDASVEHGARLREIQSGVVKLMRRFHPEVVGVEQLFFSKNIKTALKVAEARGVILATVSVPGKRVVECSPQEVKTAVTGYGAAEKHQVQRMVQMILKLKEIPQPDDAADALAIALAASRLCLTY